jgi:hypothetical protein
LPILNDRPQPWAGPTPRQISLDRYYAEQVIGGPGSFMVVAEDFAAFREAILTKLILDIAGYDGSRWIDVAARRDAPAKPARPLEPSTKVTKAPAMPQGCPVRGSIHWRGWPLA